jgi:subtilisin family serine protease
MNRRLLLGAAACTFATAAAAAQLSVAAAAAAASETAAASAAGTAGAAQPESYIVVLKAVEASAGPSAAATRARARGVRVSREYRHALNGFAASLDATQRAAVLADPDVDYVEPDGPVHADGAAEDDPTVQADAAQLPATWGLDRIDQRNRPLDNRYRYTSTGRGVTAYIFDTGIRTTHRDFGGRASGGFTAIDDGNGTADCNGHGTHVAGTVGGSTYGVAKAVRLVSVRVLDCAGFGTISGVIAGIDWATANRVSPAVANMSLTGGASRALDQAVRQSIAGGLGYTLAAGNDAGDACAVSPARVPRAITVGATLRNDSRATAYSNFGSCLDLFAPGNAIMSTWYTSDTATNTLSGTSMAAPHVAGVAALYLERHPGAGPNAVRDAIVGAATPDVLTSVGAGSPNLLVYSRGSGF